MHDFTSTIYENLFNIQNVPILVNNQLDAQFFFAYIYSIPLHVPSTPVLIIRRINCINTTSGIHVRHSENK